jgi:hypothetical protein
MTIHVSLTPHFRLAFRRQRHVHTIIRLGWLHVLIRPDVQLPIDR